jgi:hypothetical protein
VGLLIWGALSDERTYLSFTIAAGPCQRSLSRVWVPWDSRPYFTVSDLRLPFSSPPTTRRVTVEVFDPASTRITCPFITRCGPQTEHTLERFFCSNLHILCLWNTCLSNRCPATVYPHCHWNVFNEAFSSILSYYGFQSSCHNISKSHTISITQFILHLWSSRQ